MIKEIKPFNIITVHMKQASLEAINLFHERILIFEPGQEFGIKLSQDTYQTYFILEDGSLSESTTYKIKLLSHEEE